MPHQLHNTAFFHPFGDRRDIAIVNPSVAVGHADMDEVITVHGRPFACDVLLDLLCKTVIPGHIGHHTRDDALAVVVAEVAIEAFGGIGRTCHATCCYISVVCIYIYVCHTIGLSSNHKGAVGLRPGHQACIGSTYLLDSAIGLSHSDGLGHHRDNHHDSCQEGEVSFLHLTCSFWVTLPFLMI